jgi:hypothetical protein
VRLTDGPAQNHAPFCETVLGSARALPSSFPNGLEGRVSIYGNLSFSWAYFLRRLASVEALALTADMDFYEVAKSIMDAQFVIVCFMELSSVRCR